MTYDHNQLEIPDSFMALFVLPGRTKPLATRELITARYELCEDLAGHMGEQVRAQHDQFGTPREAVLSTVLAGLRAPASGLNDAEATWVVRRLAELEGWGALQPPDS